MKLFLKTGAALFIGAALASFSNAAQANEPTRTFTVIAHQNIYEEYLEYIATFDPLTFEHPPSEGLWRHHAEAVIMTIAPVLGGCECRVELDPVPAVSSFPRLVQEVISGRAVAAATATFPAVVENREEEFYLSLPVLAEDEFFVGLYTSQNRTDILAIEDLSEIAELRFGVGENWIEDQQVILERGLRLVEATDWSSVIRMIDAGRADVFMQPFSTNEEMYFVANDEGLRFYPIPDVRMSFPRARRFIVSSVHEDGAEFLDYLDRGLALMDQNGLLDAYMHAAGVISDEVNAFREF